MYKFPFSLQEHMIFHLHLKFLSYALYPFNLQEIAMSFVIIFLFKLLLIFCKERSKKWRWRRRNILSHFSAAARNVNATSRKWKA